jgi:hypothetical protein
MGYQRGAYALGYVGDLLDPIQIVRPELPAGIGFTQDSREKLRQSGRELRSSAKS